MVVLVEVCRGLEIWPSGFLGERKTILNAIIGEGILMFCEYTYSASPYYIYRLIILLLHKSNMKMCLSIDHRPT